MPAYARRKIDQFIDDDVGAIVGSLQQGYAADGFSKQYTRQTKAWARVIPKLQHTFVQLLQVRPEAHDWTILLEYPLYRLRRRIDIVILANSLVVVVECKVGTVVFAAQDRRQVEEYALDLRDFHAESCHRRIFPVLGLTDSDPACSIMHTVIAPSDGGVATVTQVGGDGLGAYLAALPVPAGEAPLIGQEWDRSVYRPVPNVIEAATSIFAGHDVRNIANADADNLQSAAARLVALIVQAREQGKRFLLVLSGVPGSGKTLAGLHVVHSAIATRVERYGDIVYLSGNTPLVVVLREALARDEYRRSSHVGERRPLGVIR